MAARITPMTGMQMLFGDNLIMGMKKTVAYQRAYSNQTLTTGCLKVAACRLAKHPKIVAYVAAGRKASMKAVLMTRDDKRGVYGSIALDKTEKSMARIAACKADNRMTGDDAPIRVEGEITLNAIFNDMEDGTGLPSAADKKFMKAKVVEEVLTTAMERAG